jgi:hypothetical protein
MLLPGLEKIAPFLSRPTILGHQTSIPR